MSLLRNETSQILPYNFQADLDNTLFSFTTKNEIKYDVAFVNSTAFFGEDHPLLAAHVYEMSIICHSDNPPFDTSTGATVIEVVKQFFLKQNVLLSICDSTDGRQEIRKERFQRWVDVADLGDTFEKIDGHVEYADGYEVISSIILKTDFHLKDEIINAFYDINDNL